jgi:hypothetical protein
MSIQRKSLSILRERMADKRKFIQVVMGPRQIGKTTMVNQLLEQASVPTIFGAADGLIGNGQVWIAQQWEQARFKLLQSEASELWLALDEIQKVENWSELVKRFWDEDTRNGTNIKLVLLGSSRLLLQTGLSESLAGRFEVMYLGHWTYLEMQEAFGWTEAQYAWFGAYPGSAELIGNESRWKDYVSQSLVETSISKDILMLTRVDKPALMRRLFELGCHSTGQMLSFTKILGQLQDAGNTTTLSHYLNLLHSAGLLCGLEKFSPEKIRQRASSPKFQVHNPALYSSQLVDSFEKVQLNPALWGRVVESAIGSHLLNFSIQEKYELHYWREGDMEMDFILSKGDKSIAIEVKSGYRTKALGADAFHKKYPETRLLVIERNGISWQEFLRVNPSTLF